MNCIAKVFFISPTFNRIKWHRINSENRSKTIYFFVIWFCMYIVGIECFFSSFCFVIMARRISQVCVSFCSFCNWWTSFFVALPIDTYLLCSSNGCFSLKIVNIDLYFKSQVIPIYIVVDDKYTKVPFLICWFSWVKKKLQCIL